MPRLLPATVTALLLALAGWLAWTTAEAPSPAPPSDEPPRPPPILGPPVATDLSPFGLRLTIDVPADARLEPAPFGAAVRFPDGSGLTVETSAGPLDADKAAFLSGHDAELLADAPDGYLVRAGREFRFRKDVPDGPRTISAAGSRAGSRVTPADVEPLWAAARSLRRTAAQAAAEPARTAALAGLARDGVRTSAEPGRGVTVRFPGRTPTDDLDLAPLADIPDLTGLEITGGGNLSPAGFAAVRRLPNLRKLDLRGPWVTATFLARLAGHPALEDISLRRTSVGDSGLAAVSGLPNLRSLAVTRGPSGGGAVVTGPGLRHLAGLTKLRHLRLSGQPVTDAGITSLPPLPDLRTLDLAHARLTDAGLGVIQSIENLESLGLTHTRVTGAGLGRFAGATRLDALALGFTDLTDAGLAAARGLPVRSLDLTATRVTDFGAEHLASLPNLVVLDLSHTRVTDAGLTHMAGLPGLAVLGLRHTGVAGPGLTALGRCPSLTALDLSGCPCGDDAVEPALDVPRLARLGLTDTKLTDAGLSSLAKLPADRPLAVTCDTSAVGPTAAALAQDRPLVTGLRPARPDPPLVVTDPPFGSTGPPNFAGMVRRVGAAVARDEAMPGEPVIGVVLTGDAVTDADLADLRGLPAVKTLAVRSDRVTDGGLAYLAGLTTLEDLSLAGRRIVGDGFVHLTGLTNLRRLGLPAHPLPARALAHLTGLRSLEEIDIPDDVTAAGPAAAGLYAALPNLRKLDAGRVGSADLLRLRPLSAVADLRFRTRTESAARWGLAGLSGMPGLRRLAVEGGVDDRGLAEITRWADALESLEVTNAIYVTDEGAAAVAGLPLLRRLALRESRVTDAGLARLAAAARLDDLDLSGSRVTDAGLAALGRARLRRLALADTDLTDAGVPGLAGLAGLEWVSVRGTRVTAGGLTALRAAAPGLTIDPPPPRPATEAE